MADAIDNILNAVAATGALGTAAYGLVDITKFFWGGISRVGLGDIARAVTPFIRVARPGQAFGTEQILGTLQANWMNGMPKQEQKAVAKSLIRLLLKPETAAEMATAASVDPNDLEAAARRIFNNDPLTDEDMRALGAFDVAVSASLDYGYERGDQRYRNAAKTVAAVISVVLAFTAGAALYGKDGACSNAAMPCIGPYWPLAALLAGLIATPLAPMVKDVSSALQTAVKAMSPFKR
jgi:hypothetical protein